jgi:NADH:ubiquinone reductase (H+-translocating)
MASEKHSASDLGAARAAVSLDRWESETLAISAADRTRRARERESALHVAVADRERLQPKRERVVVIGAGFGGLSAAKGLAKAPVDVVVIDRHNYHLFQPLLYQVATAGLSPADIASPIRSVLSRQRNATVILANVEAVDAVRKVVHAEDREIPYDRLIIATGAKHSYFSHDDWARHAPGLKSIDDATLLRRRILLAFEKAEVEEDPLERARLLSFVIIGGGPTGVEMAGAIAELARKALSADFRSIDPRLTRVTLIESGPRLLASFHPNLSQAARRSLEKLNVQVRLGKAAIRCDEFGVEIDRERIEASNIIWAAGVMASPANQWLGVEGDRAGRVTVNPDLSVPGHPEIFVIGDTANCAGGNGRPLPGVAPVAKQEGAYVAMLINARLNGSELPPFRYRNFGSLATIGRKTAVVEIGSFRVTGFIAWAIWSVAHIYYLIGFRNRLAVAVNWSWNYLTFERGTRLITGLTGSRMPSAETAPPTTGGPASSS